MFKENELYNCAARGYGMIIRREEFRELRRTKSIAKKILFAAV